MGKAEADGWAFVPALLGLAWAILSLGPTESSHTPCTKGKLRPREAGPIRGHPGWVGLPDPDLGLFSPAPHPSLGLGPMHTPPSGPPWSCVSSSHGSVRGRSSASALVLPSV